MGKTITTQNLTLTAPNLNNFNGEIDWGDGTREPYQVTLSHVYMAPGNYTISLIGISEVSNLEIDDLSRVYVLDLSKI